MKKLSELRVDYSMKENFNLEASPQNPMDLFKDWFSEARAKIDKDANAMALGTIDKNGFPRTRFVLLKEIHENGFIFYTNYTSQKGQDIEDCNKVSLTFLWKDLEKQVRIVGAAYKVDREKSKEYFHSRPRESQIAAYVSAQSSPLESKDVLKERFEMATQQFMDQEIPYPAFWGGYLVEPIEIEFWQGRESRMHDRIVYTKKYSEWIKTLLQP